MLFQALSGTTRRKIRGRRIHTNTHVARSMSDCCGGTKESVDVLQKDFEIAFDRVRPDVHLSVLGPVGFQNIIFEVELAYRNCSMRLVINRS